jgi:membrane-associated PAP2 superfamily phosphatase
MIRERRYRRRSAPNDRQRRFVRSRTNRNRTAVEATPDTHVSVAPVPQDSGIRSPETTVDLGGSMTHVQTLDGIRTGDRWGRLARGLRRAFLKIRLSLAAGVDGASPIAAAAAVTAVLSAYFVLLPGVDLAMSALFHDPALGFVATMDPLLIALRKSSTWVMGLMLLGLVVVAIRGWWTGGREARKALFLISGLALASGLVVNGLFKSLWGRARPIQIEAFGGEAQFTSAWTMTDQCASNCSFVSGEASSAAWIAAVAVLMTPQAWRPVLIPAAFAYAAALSFNRLLFGGHFLSDIVLSWAITALVLCLLHRLMLHCPVAARRARRRRRVRSGPMPAMA